MKTNQLESVLQDELHQVLGELRAQVQDPAEAAAVQAMVSDAAMLPVRIARGEDVSSLAASLSAEAQNRALAHREMARAAVEKAWQRVIVRIVGGLLSAALA